MEAYEALKRTELARLGSKHYRFSTLEDIDALLKELEEFQQAHPEEDNFSKYVDYFPAMNMAKTFSRKGYNFYSSHAKNTVVFYISISWKNAQPNRTGSIYISDENGDQVYQEEAKTQWTWPWSKRK